MEKKISDNDYLIVRDKEIKNKLLLKSKDRLFFENNKKLKGSYKIKKDILKITWDNGIIHFCIKCEEYYDLHYFENFDLVYYKKKVNLEKDDLVYGMSHWISKGRLKNIACFEKSFIIMDNKKLEVYVNYSTMNIIDNINNKRYMFSVKDDIYEINLNSFEIINGEIIFENNENNIMMYIKKGDCYYCDYKNRYNKNIFISDSNSDSNSDNNINIDKSYSDNSNITISYSDNSNIDISYSDNSNIDISYSDIHSDNDSNIDISYNNDVNYNNISSYFKNNEKILIYYSKLRWDLLFQRPHQIMCHFDKSYLKIFITSNNKLEYIEKYNLLIISYKYKDILYNNNNSNITIYYTDTQLYNEIKELYDNKKIKNVIFDLIDAPIDEFEVWKPNLSKSVLNADYVLYSHKKLIEYLNNIDENKEYHYISNACDFEHFKETNERIYPKPLDIPITDKLILGYYGAFADWLDYDLIKKYADEGKYHILMIGGHAEAYNKRFEHNNISWLDHKPYKELPIYLSWFDVCFLPFRDCELTKYVNPCKLWEYMASGKEIIKTGIYIDCDKIVKYEDECKKIYNILNNKILIVLDKYKRGGLEKHTDILEEELKAEICVIGESIRDNVIKYEDDVYKDYDVFIFQNTFIEIKIKQENKKYIYMVHSQCDWWNEEQKNNVRNNNKYIDIYIFVGDSVKNNFEKNIINVGDRGYVVENQVSKIENDKIEIKGLFVSCGSYNELKNHKELIEEFSKLNKELYKLEIYGDIHDVDYYNELKEYIKNNNLENIILYEYDNNYLERLKEGEYFILLSKSEGCSYSILEAIALNKKIICSEGCANFEQIKYYPNKIIFNKDNSRFEWFCINKVNYLCNGYSKKILNLLMNKEKIKKGRYSVSNIMDVILEIENKNNNILKNGYSVLLRVKNEEGTIRKCIEDIVDLVDEIIIVDNNSEDNTLKIIKELELLYNNIFVYEYKINVPKCGKEHFEKFKKNKYNTLKNYYNWTESKATYNKKIKWDGDFYCIRYNFNKLLNNYKESNNLNIGIWFSGITVFIDNKNNFYIKNNSLYNECRLFLNNDVKIWNDNIINDLNYCETSQLFINSCNFLYFYTEQIFIEIKNSNKNELENKSIIDIEDGRENIDMLILNNINDNNKLKQLFDNNILNKTVNIYNDIYNYTLYLEKYGFETKLYYNYYEYTDTYSLKDNIIKNNIKCFNDHIFKKKKNLLLIIDSYGWAFDNISKEINKYNRNYNIQITTYPELYLKLNNNLLIYEWRKKYYYCDINLNNTEHCLFFWYGGENVEILENLKKYNIKTFNLCVYDYSKWINNNNIIEEKIVYKDFIYFFNNINNYLYACPFIKKEIDNKINNNKIKSYKCYDGVDKNLFYYTDYNNDILYKDKLIVGWIGNSNPIGHGINKGFENIKNCILKLNDKFIFKPQDSYTCKKIIHDDIPNYLKDIDIIICFSLAEGTPNQILEASSMGKCWISTDVGIVRELNNTINNCEAGIIINRNEKELEEALLKLYYNREFIINYGINGRKNIDFDWGWDKKVEQFYNFFDNLD